MSSDEIMEIKTGMSDELAEYPVRVQEAADELGKSLAKIMLSQKYDNFTIQDSIAILNMAMSVAIDKLLEHETEDKKEDD